MVLLKFDMQTWRERPDLYPMIESERLLITDTRELVRDGDILVCRDSGLWFAVPDDVYRKIRREFL